MANCFIYHQVYRPHTAKLIREQTLCFSLPLNYCWHLHVIPIHYVSKKLREWEWDYFSKPVLRLGRPRLHCNTAILSLLGKEVEDN